jgi:hypothetical protein
MRTKVAVSSVIDPKQNPLKVFYYHKIIKVKTLLSVKK